jgi:A/G-specific adenine glycosylase
MWQDTDIEDAGKSGEDGTMSAEEARDIADALIEWYHVNKRDLPWRDQARWPQPPYAVWVSEVMLQQTRVATVIDYFERWMARWPTVESLAGASEEEVNEMWSGLGYYRRARMLHQGAKTVVEKYKGRLPSVSPRRVPGRLATCRTRGACLRRLPGGARWLRTTVTALA